MSQVISDKITDEHYTTIERCHITDRKKYCFTKSNDKYVLLLVSLQNIIKNKTIVVPWNHSGRFKHHIQLKAVKMMNVE